MRIELAKKNYKKPDHYARKARKLGYEARSVFKLEEVDKKEGLIRPGMRVLDLGAAPGSWMRYASGRTGRRGLVVGVDLKPLKRPLAENERFIEADVSHADKSSLLKYAAAYDVVLSDMMPPTTGQRSADHLRSMGLAERALEIADEALRPGGSFLVKVFQGSEFESFREELRERFSKVKVKKPRSSRATSKEIYLLGLGKKDGGDEERK